MRVVIVDRRDARRIFEGRKVQHRVLRDRKCPLVGESVPISFREPNPSMGYEEDGTPKLEAVRICHINVLERWETTLYGATNPDAEAEGYKDRDELIAEWGSPGFDLDVWVFRFELDPRHRPRLLSSGIIAGRQGAYVESRMRALPDEPEAVDFFAQEEITAAAHDRARAAEERRREERSSLSFHDQLAELEAEARARYVDIRSELRAIERWGNAAAQKQQLERIRQKLETPLAA
jgi:hypothetical protein